MSGTLLTEDALLLQGRYRLRSLLRETPDHQLWLATDQDIDEVLVKVWPYYPAKPGDRPSEAERALWDIELRHLFRLTSSPEAESRLVTLRNAGVDSTNHCFLLVLAAPGLIPLERLLRDRSQCEWLRDIRRIEVRKEVWRAIRSMALGLAQIHDQQMIHGAISASSVFVHPQRGPGSLRLGGFEWTIRVASPNAPDSIRTPDLVPPELAEPSVSYSFESDWFSFGVLAARILAPSHTFDEDGSYSILIEAIRTSDYLDLEKVFLERLLDRKPATRLARGSEIGRSIDLVLARLNQPLSLDEQSYLALVVTLGPGKPVTTALCEEDDSILAFDEEAQRVLIENDLAEPSIVRLPAGGHVLLGKDFQYWLDEFAPFGEHASGAWDLAFCNARAEVRFSEDSIRVQLNRIPIKVYNTKDAIKRRDQITRRAVSWKPFLPTTDDSRIRRARLDLLNDFFRITNQVEILFCDAELFKYHSLGLTRVLGFDELIIEEVKRDTSPLRLASRSDNLIEFLERARDDDPKYGDDTKGGKVFLGSDESLFITDPPDVLSWTIEGSDPTNGTVHLRRPHTPDSVDPPAVGFLRTYGLQGQLKLISRRKDGIESLRNHYYLLQALLFPDNVYINTGEARLPLAVKEEDIDPAKREALHKLWQTRPIFALQGPPGTGKTTLVANLIGQILEDDSMAQVLITAQAHPAVDVLRKTVRKDVFSKMAEDDQPIAVRVNLRAGKNDEDIPERVTRRVLERAIERLGTATRSPFQNRWHAWLQGMLAHFGTEEVGKGASDMVQLIKRSANITYCTSTAATLAALTDAGQSFDWSIIEEAGKAHGFDLALPLQLGHRWLLIGDHYQLRPYRYDNFKEALQDLDGVFDRLKSLPAAASRLSLVDWDLFRAWQGLEPPEKGARRDFWLEWLAVFETLYKTCEGRIGTHQGPGLSKMLDVQHRMHPVIAEMVSRAFYRNKIRNGKKVEVDGVPTSVVCHPFDIPEGIRGRAILWLDVPPANIPASGNHTSTTEVLAVEKLLRVMHADSSLDEPVSTVVLSPYLRQVLALNKQLRSITVTDRPRWLPETRQLAQTVDSFQGNQAQLVIVSLVRNNNAIPGGKVRPLGFLDERERINVLFSRAEQLLVLVGSWEFFKRQVRDTPADPDQYAGFWRIAVDYLEECFRDDRALLLPASALGT